MAGERGDRVRRSPQFRDGKFRNSVPSSTIPTGGAKLLREALRRHPDRKPGRAGPGGGRAPAPAPADGLHLTWYGHASALVEIEGATVLLDPVWSDRVSAVQLVGPRRLHPVPVPLAELPEIDAVVISHDHYDHLDLATVTRPGRAPARRRSWCRWASARTCERWGVPADGSSSWTGTRTPPWPGVRFTLTPARHFSGRGFTRDRTLWGSWVIAGPTPAGVLLRRHRVLRRVRRRSAPQHGPFDATLVQIGAYGEGWPDIHMTPEDGAARPPGRARRAAHPGALVHLRARLPRLVRTGRAAVARGQGAGRRAGRTAAGRTGRRRRAARARRLVAGVA